MNIDLTSIRKEKENLKIRYGDDFNEIKFNNYITTIEITMNKINKHIGVRQKQALMNLGFVPKTIYHKNNYLRENCKITSKEIEIVKGYNVLVIKFGLAEKGYNYNWLELDFNKEKERFTNGN